MSAWFLDSELSTCYSIVSMIISQCRSDYIKTHGTGAEEGSFEWYGQVQQFFNKMVGKVDGSKCVCIAYNQTCKS